MHHITRLLLVLLLVWVAHTRGQYVETTIVVGRGPVAMTYDSVGRKLYVANEGSNTVSVIDTRTNLVRATIPVGAHPSALCWNRETRKVYCANNDQNNPGTVSVISTASDSVVATLTVGRNPAGLVHNSLRNKVYCANRGGSSVTVIDGQADRVLSTVSLSQNPNDILYNPASDRIYTCGGAYGQPGKVHVIDCATDRLVTTVNSGVNAWAMSANPLANRLYIANAGSNNLTVLDCGTNQTLATLAVGNEPHCVLWTASNKVFCGAYWDELLRHMPGDSLRFKGSVLLPGKPERFLYNPRSDRLYVACPLETRVVVLDARDGQEKVIADLATGGGPKPMAFCAEQERIYVGNSWDSTVTVIRDRSGVGEKEGRPEVPVGRLLSPNPAGNSVFLSGSAPLRMYDRSGALAACLVPGSNDIAHLGPGVYLVPVSGRGTRPVLKLIVFR